MNLRLVSADCGKANTKVFSYDTSTSKTDKAIIATNVAPVNNLVKASMDGTQYIVNIRGIDDEIDGEWMIGTIGGESSNSNSKMDKIHKIMALTAIALVTENGDSVIPAIHRLQPRFIISEIFRMTVMKSLSRWKKRSPLIPPVKHR